MSFLTLPIFYTHLPSSGFGGRGRGGGRGFADDGPPAEIVGESIVDHSASYNVASSTLGFFASHSLFSLFSPFCRGWVVHACI